MIFIHISNQHTNEFVLEFNYHSKANECVTTVFFSDSGTKAQKLQTTNFL